MWADSVATWPWAHVYVTVLVLSLTCSSFLVSIGRDILESGLRDFYNAEVLRFPYPLCITLLQQFTASILILSTGGCLHLLKSFISRWDTDSYNFIPLSDIPPDESSYLPNRSTGSREWWNKTIVILILSVCITCDLALINYVFCFAPLEIFVLSRVLVLPLLVFVLRFENSNLSGAVGPSFLLSFGIVLTGYRHDLPWPSRAVGCAFTSSVFEVVWILLAKKAFARNAVEVNSAAHGGLDELPSSNVESKQRLAFDAWWLICCISLMSAAILVPAVLLSGEPGQISRNFYINDAPYLWLQLRLKVACIRFVFTCSTLLYIRATTAFDAAFLLNCVYASQIPWLTSRTLLYSQHLGMSLCILSAVWYLWYQRQLFTALYSSTNQQWSIYSSRSRVFTVRLVLLLVLIAICSMGAIIFWNLEKSEVERNSLSLAIPEFDDYLGPRLPATTTADLGLLNDECQGSPEDINVYQNARKCIDYLATQQDTYFLNSSTGLKLKANQAEEDQALVSTSCTDNPILYHAWWTGLPSWRIEMFIKSYFYTQNVACSRLWIWLNLDMDPDAISKWLKHPSITKFLPLIASGDLQLKAWRLPPRVPISPTIDPLDDARYYSQPGPPNARGETLVADSIIQDRSGQRYIQFYEPGDQTQLIFYTVASSDAARLVILHLHGGVYLDIDMLLLRDMRPLLLPGRPFSERWGAHPEPALYNNALVALPANSTMSSYLLTGGTRMGLMYHFMLLGKMMLKEGRDATNTEHGLLKLESAFFDPPWPALDGMAKGRCMVPCLSSYADVFKARLSEDEWSAYDGRAVPASEDGNNRTMQNFFRGAFAYHMHNQWGMEYEQGSWIDVVTSSHNRFFDGTGTNAYGEKWARETVARYER